MASLISGINTMKKQPQQTKQTQQEWARVLDSMVQDGTKLAAHWLPKGAAEVEKQTQIATKKVQDFQQRRKEKAAITPRKSRLLWLLPLPVIPASIFALASGQFSVFLVNAIASGLFLGGVLLARRGFEQEVQQPQVQFQSRSPLPFKTLGGITIAVATTLTAWLGAHHSLPSALAFGAGAFAAFALLYGLDPRQQPARMKNNEKRSKEVTEALEKAEKKILAIEQAGKSITEPELSQRLTRITALGRDILAEIARDPRDLQRARKFLNTYLNGAQRVVTGYAEAHVKGRNHPLEDNFRRVLASIEDIFNKQYQRLLENDLHDLDVHIEVLETQLKHEGLN